MALNRKRNLALWSIAAIAVFWVLASFIYSQNQRVKAAEDTLGLDSARILSEKITEAAEFRVLTLAGNVLASGSEPRWFGMFPAKMTVRYPYSVGYFVDFKRINSRSYRWDEATKTLAIEIPDVQPDPPNIDASRAAHVSKEGLLVGADSATKMIRAAAGAAAARAEVQSKQAVNLDRARASAREKVERLLGGTLRAAKLGQVNVIVRFPWEPQGGGTPVQWDESRTVKQVLRP